MIKKLQKLYLIKLQKHCQIFKRKVKMTILEEIEDANFCLIIEESRDE